MLIIDTIFFSLPKDKRPEFIEALNAHGDEIEKEKFDTGHYMMPPKVDWFYRLYEHILNRYGKVTRPWP